MLEVVISGAMHMVENPHSTKYRPLRGCHFTTSSNDPAHRKLPHVAGTGIQALTNKYTLRVSSQVENVRNATFILMPSRPRASQSSMNFQTGFHSHSTTAISSEEAILQHAEPWCRARRCQRCCCQQCCCQLVHWPGMLTGP